MGGTSGIYLVHVFLGNKLYGRVNDTYLLSSTNSNDDLSFDSGLTWFDIFTQVGRQGLYSVLDTMIQYPNRTIVEITGAEDVPRPAYDWRFEVDKGSNLVSLMLLDENQKLLRLFFNFWLSKGTYVVYHSKYDGLLRPIKEGDYYYFMRINSEEVLKKIHLLGR